MSDTLSYEEKEKAEIEFILSKGFKEISEERYKWESPEGIKFIFSSSAYDWQQRKDTLEEKGYIFKVGTPYSGFGYNVFVRTAHGNKMIHVMRETREEAQADMDGYVEYYSQFNKEEALKHLQVIMDADMWSDNLDSRLNKILRVKTHYDTDYYSLQSYTDLVNLCIDFVKTVPIHKQYSPPTKPSYEVEGLPNEFKETGQQEWTRYNLYLKEYNDEQEVFNRLDSLKKITDKEYKKYHMSFIDFVLDFAQTYYGDMDFIHSSEIKQYIQLWKN